MNASHALWLDLKELPGIRCLMLGENSIGSITPDGEQYVARVVGLLTAQDSKRFANYCDAEQWIVSRLRSDLQSVLAAMESL